MIVITALTGNSCFFALFSCKEGEFNVSTKDVDHWPEVAMMHGRRNGLVRLLVAVLVVGIFALDSFTPLRYQDEKNLSSRSANWP